MKKIITVILLTFVTTFLARRSQAASLNSFTVEPQFLTNGIININSNPQNILVDFSITRQLLPVDSTNLYENVNWTVIIELTDHTSGNRIMVSVPLSIGTNDFDGAFCNKTVSVSLPANERYALQSVSGYYYSIDLRYADYQSYETSVSGQSSNSYAVSNTFTPATACTGTTPFGPTTNPVWQGCTTNTIYDGTPVPFPTSYYKNGSNYYVYNWCTQDLNQNNNNIPGTIINFNDNSPVLTQGQSIFSPNGQYRLTLQTDGNLVLYKENGTSHTSYWSTLTQGESGLALFYQTDGHLVLYNGLTKNSPSIWYSGLYDSGGSLTRFAQPGFLMAYPFYKLQDDGNLCMYWPNGVEPSAGAAATPVRIIFASTDSGINQGSSVVSSHQGSIGHSIVSKDIGGGYGYSSDNLFEITH